MVCAAPVEDRCSHPDGAVVHESVAELAHLEQDVEDVHAFWWGLAFPLLTMASRLQSRKDSEEQIWAHAYHEPSLHQKGHQIQSLHQS